MLKLVKVKNKDTVPSKQKYMQHAKIGQLRFQKANLKSDTCKMRLYT